MSNALSSLMEAEANSLDTLLDLRGRHERALAETNERLAELSALRDRQVRALAAVNDLIAVERGEPFERSGRLRGAVPSVWKAIQSLIKDGKLVEFTVEQVRELLNSYFPDVMRKSTGKTTVNAALSVLHRKGALEMVRPGRGPRPAVYRVTA